MRSLQANFTAILVLALSLCTGCEYNKCYNCEVVKSQTATEEKKAESTPEQLAEIAQARQARLTALREQLKLTPLFAVWHHGITGEKILSLSLSLDVLFVETESKKIFAFESRSGIPMWVYSVGERLDFPPEVHRDKVYFSSMATLHILNKKTGEPLIKKIAGFVPSSPWCPTDTYLYVGSWDNFIYAINPQTGMREWRHRLDGYIEARPSEKDGILFLAGTDGKIYAVNAKSGRRHSISSEMGARQEKWAQDGYYETRGVNVAPVAIRDNAALVYAGSCDYNLYCLDRIYGALRWKFESGGEIKRAPHVIGNTVYVVSNAAGEQDSTLYLLNGDSGAVKGDVKHGYKVFFVGKRHDWILRHDKKVAMVSDAGEVKNIFDLEAFDLFASNTSIDKDRMGYMATQDGFIMAVEDR